MSAQDSFSLSAPVPADRAGWQPTLDHARDLGRTDDLFMLRRLMQAAGHLTREDDILALVADYETNGAPRDGAKLLDASLRAGYVPNTPGHLRTLAGLWREARNWDAAADVLSRLTEMSPAPDLYVEWGEAEAKRQNCDVATVAFLRAKGTGRDRSGLVTGYCYYRIAERPKSPSCWSAVNNAKADAYRANQQAALEAFASVPQGSAYRSRAEQWVAFIEAEKEADEYRCGSRPSRDPGLELCFIKIRQAYDAQVFTGIFELDEACKDHKAEFDRLYRQR